MPERQVSLQELESKLDSYIHDVENGATVVVSRDGAGPGHHVSRRRTVVFAAPRGRRPSSSNSGYGGVLHVPDSKQIAASVVETAAEIDDLQLGKGPGQLFVVTRSIKQRSDASFESVLLEGVQKLSLHPYGTHRVGGENEDEPIAALQCSADLVVPLLGTPDVGVAVPNRHGHAWRARPEGHEIREPAAAVVACATITAEAGRMVVAFIGGSSPKPN